MVFYIEVLYSQTKGDLYMKNLYIFLFLLVYLVPTRAQFPGECNYFCSNCNEIDKFSEVHSNLHLVLTSDSLLYEGGQLITCYNYLNIGIFPIDLIFPFAREVSWQLYNQNQQVVWTNVPNGEVPDTHIVHIGFGQGFLHRDTVDISLLPLGNYELHAALTALPGDSLVLPLTIEHSIPVELINFIAEYNNNTITLTWQTATETNNQGFVVELFEKGLWQNQGFVPGNGTSTEKQSYNFTDKIIQPGLYQYRLQQIDYNGLAKVIGSVQIMVIENGQVELFGNFPNPFNSSTVISFYVPHTMPVQIDIVNILGNRVATILDEVLPAGYHEVLFQADKLSSGVYFYRWQSPTNKFLKKMIFTK